MRKFEVKILLLAAEVFMDGVGCFAALLPMARITVAAPVTASPPAKTPLRLVRPSSSATMQPRLFVSSPSVVDLMRGFARPESHDDHVAVNPEIAPFLYDRAAASARVGFAKFHLHAFYSYDLPFFIADYADGVGEHTEFYPSCLAWCTSSTR